MISFGFKDFYAGNGFDKCLEAGTAFRGLTNTISQIETFLLAETKAGTEAKAGAADAVETFGIVETIVRTQGTETGTVVTLAMEIVGTIRALGIVGIAETIEAGAETGVTEALEIAGIIGIAGTKAGIALRMKAFSSCARLNKNSR
jgi:hypothetical protein